MNITNINYWKNNTLSSNQLIYILGLPRSGKSTIYNILSSCKNTQSLEEPLNLSGLALKSSMYNVGSRYYKDLKDLYLANLENDFSELFLGRLYNFREKDKSYILNYKTKNDINFAHSLSRRIDVIEKSKEIDESFIIAFNDMEHSLDFISNGLNNVKFVYLKRNIIDIALEITKKKWFSNEQLSNLINLTPAYGSVLKLNNQKIYLPYLISTNDSEFFLSLNQFERSLMFAFLQDSILSKEILKYDNSTCSVPFEQLIKNTNKTCIEIIEKLNLKPTKKTFDNIDNLSKNNIRIENKKLEDLNISNKLLDYITNFKENINE